MDNRETILRSCMGRQVHIIVDRPVGYDHHGLIYPVNYGYLPGILAGDGEEQDVYILGVSQPLAKFDGIIIGAALRSNDVEDKLIAVPAGMTFTPEEMARAVHFQEQYFDSLIIAF